MERLPYTNRASLSNAGAVRAHRRVELGHTQSRAAEFLRCSQSVIKHLERPDAQLLGSLLPNKIGALYDLFLGLVDPLDLFTDPRESRP